jgi:predicted dehydrogenase
MNSTGFSRRWFFQGALLAGAIPAGGFGSTPSLSRAGFRSPNEKLNIASIGAGSQPFIGLRYAYNLGRENVTALADVDWERGAQGFNAFPKAAKYKDFRQMLDKSGKDIDCVIVGTPDHMHATCALACMQMGKGVYVEKPLTRTAWEARLLTQAAEKYKVATQMGNQGYSHDATRVACEIIWSGEIGDVKEVHAWTGRSSWPQGMTKIPGPTAVPSVLDWDLWLGCAAFRPYTAGDADYDAFTAARAAQFGRGSASGSTALAVGSNRPLGRVMTQEDPLNQLAPQGGGFYMPWNWRGFYDFGTGLVGDWGIHIMGPANWALQLHSKYLVSVECVKKSELPPFTFPEELTVRFDFKERPGGMPPVSIYWYHGDGDHYLPPGMTAEEARKISGTGPQVGPAPMQRANAQAGRGGPQPGAPGGAPGGAAGGRGAQGAAAPGGQRSAQARPTSGYNCIFAGTKGYLGTSGRGEGVGLLPGSRWADYKLPPAYLTRSPGASFGDNQPAHMRDWLRACKGGTEACSHFGVAGPFAEWMILAAASVHAEGKLMWDYEKCEVTNNREVNKWIRPAFRKGWELKL